VFRRGDVRRNGDGVQLGRSVSQSTLALLVALLTIALVVGTSLALAADGDSSQPTSPGEEGVAAPVGEEIPSLRTATSETFELPGGTRETVIYQSPIHYNDDGTWRPIEPGLDADPLYFRKSMGLAPSGSGPSGDLPRSQSAVDGRDSVGVDHSAS
jgi:hypothetical protein